MPKPKPGSGPPLRLRLLLADHAVDVHVSDPAAAAFLRPVYAAYQTGRSVPPGDTLEITGDASAWVLAWQSGDQVAGEGLGSLAEAFEWELTRWLLAALSADVHLHAGGVCAGGRAALVLGRSGAGKSTVATWWSLSGHPVLGDDLIPLDADGHVRPFRRLFKIPPGVLAEAGVELADTPCWVDGASEAWFDPASHGGWADATPVALLVVLQRGASPVPAVQSATDRLTLLLASGLTTGLGSVARFERLASLAERVPVITVPVTGAAETTGRIRAALDRLP